MKSLSDRIRAANPEAGQPLPERVEAGLNDIMADRWVSRRSQPAPELSIDQRWRLRILAGVGLAAMLIISALVLVITLRPQAAVAATPDPLQIRGTEFTKELLVKDAMKVIPASPGAFASTRGAIWEGWFLQLDADQPVTTYIQPQRTEVEWSPDLSGKSRVTAEAPSTTSGHPIYPAPDGAETFGSMLYAEEWGPGELAVPFLEVPPEGKAAMRDYLDNFLTEQGLIGDAPVTSGEYLFAVTALMQVWTLSGAAQLAAIQVLLEAPAVAVIGNTTDRAGRDGVILEVASTELDPGYKSQLVIDAKHWRFLAVERSTIDGLPDFHIPAGSVTDYTIWR